MMVNKPKRRTRATESATQPMKSTALMLPPDLHAKLKEAGAASGLGFSGEMRTRLEASFADEDASPVTTDLLARIKRLAAGLEGITERPWDSSTYDFKTLRAGINMLFDLYEPKDNDAPPGKDTLFYVLSYDADTPEQFARALLLPILTELATARRK